MTAYNLLAENGLTISHNSFVANCQLKLSPIAFRSVGLFYCLKSNPYISLLNDIERMFMSCLCGLLTVAGRAYRCLLWEPSKAQRGLVWSVMDGGMDTVK
jgi:hypothetical protein